MVLLGTSTTNRPGSETSWVSRAPLAPMGFLVTWQRMVWRAFRICSIRRSAALLVDVLGVVAGVAAVEHGVLRRADVDEGRLHARQHVLDLAQVDVAVDLGDVVGRAGDVVLDERAALEHGDLGGARAARGPPSGSGRPGGPCAPCPGACSSVCSSRSIGAASVMAVTGSAGRLRRAGRPGRGPCHRRSPATAARPAALAGRAAAALGRLRACRPGRRRHRRHRSRRGPGRRGAGGRLRRPRAVGGAGAPPPASLPPARAGVGRARAGCRRCAAGAPSARLGGLGRRLVLAGAGRAAPGSAPASERRRRRPDRPATRPAVVIAVVVAVVVGAVGARAGCGCGRLASRGDAARGAVVGLVGLGSVGTASAAAPPVPPSRRRRRACWSPTGGSAARWPAGLSGCWRPGASGSGEDAGSSGRSPASVSVMGAIPSHDARASACGADVAPAGPRGARPGAVVQRPLVSPPHPALGASRRRARRAARSVRRPRGWVARWASSRCRASVGPTTARCEQVGADVVGDVLALALAGDRRARRRRGARSMASATVGGSSAADLDAPLAARRRPAGARWRSDSMTADRGRPRGPTGSSGGEARRAGRRGLHGRARRRRRRRGRCRGTRPATRGRWTGPGRSAAWGGARSPRSRRPAAPTRRRARSQTRAMSRWLVKRTLPVLVKRTRILIAAPTADRLGRASSVTGHLAADGEVLAGALAAAGGRDGRGHDVLDAVAGAGAAVVARGPAAVLEADLGEGVAPVLPEEVLVEPGREVVPRQGLVLGAVAVDESSST